MNYFIVCTPTGEILRTGACPLSMLADQAHEGELAFPVDSPVDDAGTYVDLVDPEQPVLRQKPPRPSEFHRWQAGGWIADVAAARRGKFAELSLACRSAIEAGFASEALGAPHTYDYAAHDQQNLSDLASQDLGIDLYLSCTDAAGDKRLRAHSQAQVVAVYRAGLGYRAGCISRLAELRSQLETLDFAGILNTTWQGG